MINTTRFNKWQDSFATFEPMWARTAKIKFPSEKRFEKAYGVKKNYQKPKYEVSTFADLAQAIITIQEDEKNQDQYSTSNGLYRERMRVAQSLNDRSIEFPSQYIAIANQTQLENLMNHDRKPWEKRRSPGYKKYS